MQAIYILFLTISKAFYSMSRNNRQGHRSEYCQEYKWWENTTHLGFEHAEFLSMKYHSTFRSHR